jgi:hypothetical protein
MSRIEAAYRVLLAVADDYEEIDHLYDSVHKEAGANVSKDELLTALGDLILDGLVDSFIYDKQQQKFRTAVRTGTSPEFWYCISDKGKQFLALTRQGL